MRKSFEEGIIMTNSVEALDLIMVVMLDISSRLLQELPSNRYMRETVRTNALARLLLNLLTKFTLIDISTGSD